MKKVVLGIIIVLLLIYTQANAISIRNAGDGARTGAQLDAGVANLSLPFDDGTNDYYATLAAMIDWIELSDFTYTGILDFTGATVSFGLVDGDIPDTITITNISQVQDITTTASEINTPLDGALVTLTEFRELETIGDTTISAAQWGYVGAANQGTATTDSPTFAGVSVSASATPGIEIKDSDDAAGTATIYGNSSGGTNDIVMSLGVEDSGGENQEYVQLDGVNEDITFNKPVNSTQNIITTGELQGLVDVTSDTTATITLTAADCDGAMRINGDNDVIDYTLPTAATGLNVLIYSPYAQVVTIDTQNTSDNIILDGTTLTNGNAIDSPGTAGDFVSLIAMDATSWIVVGKSGTWVDGGAD